MYVEGANGSPLEVFIFAAIGHQHILLLARQFTKMHKFF